MGTILTKTPTGEDDVKNEVKIDVKKETQD